MTTLPEKLIAINGSLATAKIEYAFGGAIALAYCTGEPRATRDLDVNVFAPESAAAAALQALSPHVTVTQKNRAEISANGQTRFWWDITPIDLFFNTHPFHEAASSRAHLVPFGEAMIPVLDCTTLAVFKVMFNRTKDWADLESMAEAGQLDTGVVGDIVAELMGSDDDRLTRLKALSE